MFMGSYQFAEFQVVLALSYIDIYSGKLTSHNGAVWSDVSYLNPNIESMYCPRQQQPATKLR